MALSGPFLRRVWESGHEERCRRQKPMQAERRGAKTVRSKWPEPPVRSSFGSRRNGSSVHRICSHQDSRSNPHIGCNLLTLTRYLCRKHGRGARTGGILCIWTHQLRGGRGQSERRSSGWFRRGIRHCTSSALRLSPDLRARQGYPQRQIPLRRWLRLPRKKGKRCSPLSCPRCCTGQVWPRKPESRPAKQQHTAPTGGSAAI